jgi:hypothetical protein
MTAATGLNPVFRPFATQTPELVRRTWISTTSLVTARSALTLGLVVGSPALSNKRLRCKARSLRLQEIR